MHKGLPWSWFAPQLRVARRDDAYDTQPHTFRHTGDGVEKVSSRIFVGPITSDSGSTVLPFNQYNFDDDGSDL